MNYNTQIVNLANKLSTTSLVSTVSICEETNGSNYLFIITHQKAYNGMVAGIVI